MSMPLISLSYSPGSSISLPFANICTLFTAFALDFGPFTFPVRFFGLPGVSGLGFMVDTLESLAERVLAFFADSKAPGECPVLQTFAALFYRGYDLILIRFEMARIGLASLALWMSSSSFLVRVMGRELGTANGGMAESKWDGKVNFCDLYGYASYLYNALCTYKI